MNNPPSEIDGANVLEWAWSGDKPFGYIHYENGKVAAKIYGLAICKYENGDGVYRFSCNEHWETEQDQKYGSINEAKLNIPLQYQSVIAKWQSQK
ncbi:hypothetical protein [Pseudoalteromonas rubra]|uniref:Uncharacterized protein n=1 Tax=Pseudoalteromonas rubra TaxID=43658 RepID=A0A5S3WV52_9GAMM|nr:hypothetical protein [Pseudoalteromonas rubra]TMP32903.1 hypothetical protein CWB98_20820 [Pseudoalteromonas rubra]